MLTNAGKQKVSSANGRGKNEISAASLTKEEQKLAFREEGIAYFDAGDYEKALTSFQSALDIASGKIGNVEMDVCFYKARAQYEMGDTEGAVETYTSIIEHNDHAKAYFRCDPFAKADTPNPMFPHRSSQSRCNAHRHSRPFPLRRSR